MIAITEFPRCARSNSGEIHLSVINMEIIEIGAVRLDAALTIMDEFDAFVRPVVEPKLSEFCTALTTIKQADVVGADMFPAVFARFLEWIGTGPYRLCSWASSTSASFGSTALVSVWCFPSSSKATT